MFRGLFVATYEFYSRLEYSCNPLRQGSASPLQPMSQGVWQPKGLRDSCYQLRGNAF